MWAVKTPSNKLLTYSANKYESTCGPDFIRGQAALGAILVPDEYRGPDVWDRIWDLYIDTGYTVVEVVVEIEECGGCSIPVLFEIGSQRHMPFIENIPTHKRKRQKV